MNITNEELQVILSWQESRAADFVLDDSQHNVDLIIPLLRARGRITPESLDAAVQMTLPALNFKPGREPAVIKQHLAEKAKAETDKIQADKDKRERDRQQKNANPPPRRDPRLDRYQDQEAEQKSGHPSLFGTLLASLRSTRATLAIDEAGRVRTPRRCGKYMRQHQRSIAARRGSLSPAPREQSCARTARRQIRELRGTSRCG